MQCAPASAPGAWTKWYVRSSVLTHSWQSVSQSVGVMTRACAAPAAGRVRRTAAPRLRSQLPAAVAQCIACAYCTLHTVQPQQQQQLPCVWHCLSVRCSWPESHHESHSCAVSRCVPPCPPLCPPSLSCLSLQVAAANGEVIITNDGATILNKMTVAHPAAKMLVELAKSQVSAQATCRACE